MSGSKAGDTWAEAGFSLVELVTSLIVLRCPQLRYHFLC